VKRSIVLIGFTATGKSTAGRLLAERLGWSFVDSDTAVVERAGKGLREIMHGDGEAVFRRLEHRILVHATQRHDVVVAAGAGAVLLAGNRALLARTSYVVCLEARPETIYSRLLPDAEAGMNAVARLLTQREDAVDHIAYLKQFRQPYYAIADWTVHTDHLSPNAVVEEIVHGWRFYGAASDRSPVVAPPSTAYPLGDAFESDAPYMQ